MWTSTKVYNIFPNLVVYNSFNWEAILELALAKFFKVTHEHEAIKRKAKIKATFIFLKNVGF
jgi:hypothetical protein